MRLLGSFLFFLSAAAAASAAESLVTVYVASPGINDAERDAAIRAELDGLPLTIIVRDRASLTLSTSEAGFERLSSLSQLREVRLATGREAARQAEQQPAVQYIVRLDRTAATARYAARLASKRAAEETRERGRMAQHGEIAIEGLDASGAVIAQTSVNDPRIIRYEAVGQGGRLTGRREFLRDAADVWFTLADDPRLARIRLSAMDRSGSWQTIAEVAP